MGRGSVRATQEPVAGGWGARANVGVLAGAASTKVVARARRVDSALAGATSWRDGGIGPGPLMGRETAGWPVRLRGAVRAVKS